MFQMRDGSINMALEEFNLITDCAPENSSEHGECMVEAYVKNITSEGLSCVSAQNLPFVEKYGFSECPKGHKDAEKSNSISNALLGSTPSCNDRCTSMQYDWVSKSLVRNSNVQISI